MHTYQCLSAKVYVCCTLNNKIIKRPRLHVRSTSSSTYLVTHAEHLKMMHASRSYATNLIKVGLKRANAQRNTRVYGALRDSSDYMLLSQMIFNNNNRYLMMIFVMSLSYEIILNVIFIDKMKKIFLKIFTHCPEN